MPPAYNYGGQALIEGVMMRGRDAIAVALRHPDGRIVWSTERLDSGFHATPLVEDAVRARARRPLGDARRRDPLARPFGRRGRVRGGCRARQGLDRAHADADAGDRHRDLLPVAALPRQRDGRNIENGLVQHLVEGLIRVALFVGYLLLIAQAKDVRRVFQYHGAEHMTIHALEHGDPLTTAEVRKYPTAHQRCGTEFLVVVVILSIFAFSFVGRQSPLLMVASRILLVPVIAAVGYEILRWGARHRANPLVHAIMLPGIWVQRITTRQPTDDMIEVAIVSMEQALLADGQEVPAGGEQLEREPLDLAQAPAPGVTEAVEAVEAEPPVIGS